MRSRSGILAALAVVTLGLVAVGPAAAAEEVDGLRVTSVADRAVTFEMPLPSDTVIDSTTVMKGVVAIDGRVVPATVAAPEFSEQAPRAVVIALDASGSMAGAPMSDARRAARTYLMALPEDVEAGLVTFADLVEVIARPGADHAVIAADLAAVRPEGDTSLFDGVLAALELLPEGSQGRLVVLTDGQDTVSTATLGEVRESADSAGAVVDVILLDPSEGDRQVADGLAFGGSVSSARTSADLVARFEDAAAAWAPYVGVRAVVPADIDASGAAAVVTVSIDGRVIEGLLTLPITSSLAAPAIDKPVAGGATKAPVPESTQVPALIGAGAGGLIIVLAAWALASARAARVRRERIAQVLVYASPTGGAAGAERDPALAPLWSRLGRRYALSPSGRRLAARLVAAEIPLSPAMWRGLEAAALVPMLAMAWLVLGRLWLALIVAIVVVPLVFGSVLRMRVSRRQRAFSDELPEFLLLLSSALRAGLSFSQSLESAADQHRGQVGRQIRRALAEAQLSAKLDDALLACADRMDNDDLRWTVTALSVQREVGGNLSSILDSAAATIKGRHALAREVRTLSAEGRLSAYVLIALPVGVLAFLVLFRREYVSQLWTHPLGIAMMIALVILLLVGWVWMRAIVRIRV